MNILTFATHEGYQYNLCKTGHQFDILESDKLGGVKGWDNRQRYLPKNARVISSVDDYDKYDLILCQKLTDWHSVEHIQKSMLAGADIITIPPHLVDSMLHHDLTEKGVIQFMEDAKKSL